MATPLEKIKRLRLNSDNPFPEAYKTPTDTLKGGPLAEALRAKRARQHAAETEGTTAPAKVSEEKETTKPASSSSSGKSFSQAFKEARAAGKETFSWNGKKYTTEMAGEKKSAASSEPERETADYSFGTTNPSEFKRGGKVKMSSASKRGDGCAQRGKTRGKMV
jgi:hypothetical protein